ncbi:MAG: TlpA family protein disulfide reductase [Chloroflexota bacterium]
MRGRLCVVEVLSLIVLGLLLAACSAVTPTPFAATETPAIRLPTPVPTPPPDASGQNAGLAIRPQKGYRAPDFTLTDLDGNPISLSDFRTKIVLINFWATWCPPCRAELPAIEAAYRAADDLVVLAVNFQEPPEDVRSFVASQELTFPVLLDDSGSVALTYRSRALPVSYFVDAQGIITAVHVGQMSQEMVNQYLAQARGE